MKYCGNIVYSYSVWTVLGLYRGKQRYDDPKRRIKHRGLAEHMFASAYLYSHPFTLPYSIYKELSYNNIYANPKEKLS